MPKFVSQRDFDFFQHINRELVQEVVDTPIVLFKIILDTVSVNIYGEATTKPRYRGVGLSALIRYPKTQPTSDGFGSDTTQNGVEFRFVRKLLQDVDVYPERGDIIKYNDNYYEIDNANEVQLVAGQPYYTHNIVCEAHLTRITGLDIEETHT